MGEMVDRAVGRWWPNLSAGFPAPPHRLRRDLPRTAEGVSWRGTLSAKSMFGAREFERSDYLTACVFGVAALGLAVTVSSDFARFGDFIHQYVPWAKRIASEDLLASRLRSEGGYPPGYPLLLNAVVVDRDYVTAAHRIAWVAWAILVSASCLVARLFLSRTFTIVAGTILLVNPLFLRHASHEWADLPAAALACAGLALMLGVPAGVRKGLLVAILLAGAVWIRSQASLFVAMAVLVQAYRAWRRSGPERRTATVFTAVLALALAPLIWASWKGGGSGVGLGTAILNNLALEKGQVGFGEIIREYRGLEDAAALIGWSGIAGYYSQRVLQLFELEMIGRPLVWLCWGGVVLMSVAPAVSSAGRPLVALLAIKSAVFAFHRFDERLMVDMLPIFVVAPLFLLETALGLVEPRYRKLGAMAIGLLILYSLAGGVKWYLLAELNSRRDEPRKALVAALEGCRVPADRVGDLSMGLYDLRDRSVHRFHTLLFDVERAEARDWDGLVRLLDQKGLPFLVAERWSLDRPDPDLFDGPARRGQWTRVLQSGQGPGGIVLFAHDSVGCSVW